MALIRSTVEVIGLILSWNLLLKRWLLCITVWMDNSTQTQKYLIRAGASGKRWLSLIHIKLHEVERAFLKLENSCTLCSGVEMHLLGSCQCYDSPDYKEVLSFYCATPECLWSCNDVNANVRSVHLRDCTFARATPTFKSLTRSCVVCM